MEDKLLEVHSDFFDNIVEDIKQKNLSRNHMPKLIVGTGLSVIYNIPGMKALANHLNNEISKSANQAVIDMWNQRYPSIVSNGLEAGLADLAPEEKLLVDIIKPLTARYILEQEERLHNEILNRNTGFSKLIEYLCNTVSVNNGLIDIMTPNYDRIIETICDKLQVNVITGFKGAIYSRFDRYILKKPQNIYNIKQAAWIRLFKPHGSLNWINEADNEYLINDSTVLKNKAEFIEIVTPGSSKYREELVNSTFRCMREEFNELLSSGENYSLLIFGYGFNDEHFDRVLLDSFHKNVLIIAKEVKPEIINQAIQKKNITVFYSENQKNYVIYKSQKYETDIPMWDIDQFANVFIG